MKTLGKITTCPFCGRSNDTMSGASDPKDGDVSICFKCHEVGVYEAGVVRLPSEPEAIIIASRRDVQMARDIVRSSSTVSRALFRMSRVS